MYKLTYKGNNGLLTKYCFNIREAKFYQAILGGRIKAIH